MASTNFSKNGPIRSRLRTKGGTTHSEDAEREAAVDAADLIPGCTEILNSGNSKPIRREYSMELIQGGESAGHTYGGLLTPEQVAERLNVSPDWVRDHSSRKTPRLPVIRLGGGPGRAGLLRYRASDIERFIEEMARLSERGARAV